jgi:hypothetical protein
MAVHIFVDSAGSFGLAGISSEDNRLYKVASLTHAHDDVILLPALTLDAGPALLVAWFIDLDLKVPSQATAPLRLPPKSN